MLKGLVTATKVMRKILLKYPDWKFVVVGDDGNSPKKDLSMKQWMMSELKSVNHQVLFYEGVSYDRLPNLIAQSEIVLLPSLFESFSYTCAEAMAAGKAVFGSNSGGMSDMIENGVSGFLVNPEDADDIYLKLKKIIEDEKLYFNLTNNARTQIIKSYSNDFFCNSIIKFYLKLKI